MSAGRLAQFLLSLTLLLSSPIFASPGGYGIAVCGEHLEFVAQPRPGFPK